MKALVFDVETTGTDSSVDRIIEFGAALYDWDVLRSLPVNASKEELLNSAEKTVKRFFLPDDGREVTIGAYAKHRLTRETLKDCPGFGTFAEEAAELLDEADIIITYNGMKFDIKMMTAEFARYGIEYPWHTKIYYDVFKTEVARNSNKLEAAFARYVGEDMETYGLEAHDAFSDILATVSVFNGQNAVAFQEPAKYITDDGFLTVEEWDDGVHGPEETVMVDVGKYHGVPLREVVKSDIGYCRWILNADFSKRTKSIVKACIDKFGKNSTSRN